MFRFFDTMNESEQAELLAKIREVEEAYERAFRDQPCFCEQCDADIEWDYDYW